MKSIVVLCIALLSHSSFAQEKFHANLSGFTYPISNFELQLEVALFKRASIGFKARHYSRGNNISGKSDGYSVISSGPGFLLFRGNVFETFGRFYLKNEGSGNVKGWFGQVKFGFGDFHNPLIKVNTYSFQKQSFTNLRWNTYGGGIGVGYKIILKKHFLLEAYGGLRYYSPPQYVKSEYYYPSNEFANEELARNSWYLSRSLPLDLSFKVGFQF